MEQILARHTGQSVERLREDTGRDLVLDADGGGGLRPRRRRSWTAASRRRLSDRDAATGPVASGHQRRVTRPVRSTRRSPSAPWTATEHLGAGLLAAALDLGEVLRGDPAAPADVGQRAALVLSQLGSGASSRPTTLAPRRRGSRRRRDNQPIWVRWNAGSPEEQAACFLEHDERVVRRSRESPEQRVHRRVDLGFLPEPAPLEDGCRDAPQRGRAHALGAVGGRPDDGIDDGVRPTFVVKHLAGARFCRLRRPSREGGRRCRRRRPRRLRRARRQRRRRHRRRRRRAPTGDTSTGALEAALRLLDADGFRPECHPGRRRRSRATSRSTTCAGFPGY